MNFMTFQKQLGMSSSQLTFTPSFSRRVDHPIKIFTCHVCMMVLSADAPPGDCLQWERNSQWRPIVRHCKTVSCFFKPIGPIGCINLYNAWVCG